MSSNLRGFWKEDNKKKNKKRRNNRNKFKDEFFSSKEWRILRYRVIRKYGACCMACGRSPKKHGITIHVDHVTPRSIRPDLELCFENLQILCEDCNLGKLNLDQTDWRPSEKECQEFLDRILLSTSPI